MQDMHTEQAHAVLRRARQGTLSFAAGGHAYALPLFYGFDGRLLWFHGHPGLKDEYMEDTEEACFLVVQGDGEDWSSVQVFGRLERVEDQRGREEARHALAHVPWPPEGTPDPKAPDGTVVEYWRLVPAQAVGKRSTWHAQPAYSRI